MNSKQPKKQVKVTGFFLLVQPVVVVAQGAMRVRERAAWPALEMHWTRTGNALDPYPTWCYFNYPGITLKSR